MNKIIRRQSPCQVLNLRILNIEQNLYVMYPLSKVRNYHQARYSATQQVKKDMNKEEISLLRDHIQRRITYKNLFKALDTFLTSCLFNNEIRKIMVSHIQTLSIVTDPKKHELQIWGYPKNEYKCDICKMILKGKKQWDGVGAYGCRECQWEFNVCFQCFDHIVKLQRIESKLIDRVFICSYYQTWAYHIISMKASGLLDIYSKNKLQDIFDFLF